MIQNRKEPLSAYCYRLALSLEIAEEDDTGFIIMTPELRDEIVMHLYRLIALEEENMKPHQDGDLTD